MVLREIAYVYHWQSLTCQANSHLSRQNTIPVGPSGNVFANSSWSIRFSFKHFWPRFCSCTNICHVLKFYFFFSCWKKAAPSVPAWGAPRRRGSYEAKPDSRQSGSTHCLLSLLCNQPFAWGKEKGTLRRKKGHFSPKIIATWHQIYQLRHQPTRFWLESERVQSNYHCHKIFSFSWVAVHMSEVQCSEGVK